MGFWKTEMTDYGDWEDLGIGCSCCGRSSRFGGHNPLTWIACRIRQINSYCYFTFDSYNWLSNKWDDFKERFTEKCSFCDRSNLFHPVGHHSFHSLDEDDDRYDKKWCQFCWNERVGEGGCGYQS